jgi:Maltose operon periplasmic protein precursor (MalM)
MLRLVLIAIALTAVAGCASTAPTSAGVKDLQVCCRSFADMRYAALEIDQEESIRVTEKSLVYEFSEGKSRFAAFEIKQPERVKALDIEMNLSSSWLPAASVFLPNVVFLDSERRVTRVVTEIEVRQIQNFWAGSYYFARVPVLPGERFLVVYADPGLIGQTLPFNNGGAGYVFMAGKTPIYVPGGASTHQLPRDTVGAIKLKTRG